MKYIYPMISNSLISLMLIVTASPLWGMASGPTDPNTPPPPAWVQVVPFVVMFGIIYLLLIRPQMKQRKVHERMITELKKGDKIVTKGGLIATIANMGPGFLEVKLNEETRVKIQRDAVADLYVEKIQETKPTEVTPAK